MLDFFQWFETKIDKRRPWLILGKGPSFSKRAQFDLSGYYTLSLNHAVREQPVTVAHMIDYDVVDACGEAILNNAQTLVLPWIPHVNNRPGRQNLEELAHNHSILGTLNKQGRLLWYNHSRARKVHGNSPVVRVKFFSAVGAINLLVGAGVRQIRSLGLDGGATYSNEFDDLKDKTLLANRRTSFDRQFEEIARTIMITRVDYAPLDIASPIRVYVGSTEAQMLSVKVLEFSILKHASMSVEIFPLHLSKVSIPEPNDLKNRPHTPFSFQRFLIPALAEYRGRAIYLDSDMQLFKDIRSLWTWPLEGADLLAARETDANNRRPQFSVVLLDCSSLNWDIHEIVDTLNQGGLSYEQLVYEMSVAKNIHFDLDPTWNSLERYCDGETALLHFTDMNTQPWVSRENSLGYLWLRYLFEAIDSGFISKELVRQHVIQGYVRPSLLYQVEHHIDDSFLLPKEARLLDRDFVAPYRFIRKHEGSPWLHPAKLLRAAARHYYHKSPALWLHRRFQDWLSR